MGYRAEIYSIPKKSLSNLKTLSFKKSVGFNNYKHYGFVSEPVYRRELLKRFKAKEVYSLGEANWNYEEFERFLSPLFYNKKLNEYYNQDTELKIISKEGFLFLINFYKEKILSSKKNDVEAIRILMSESKESIENMNYAYRRNIDFLEIGAKSMVSEWENLNPVDLVDKKIVTSSWKYEYAIFQLAYIYKNFNFKTHSMIYTAG